MRISIVTPSYNSATFIEETIQSILSQWGNFELEYIVIDGGSSDKTINILEKYDKLLQNKKWTIKCQSLIFKWRSEKDYGMYDAINKGFDWATGDIYAWLNADDCYEPGALQTISGVFAQFSEVSWIKGLTTLIESNGRFIRKSPLRIYHQTWLASGIYGYGAYFLEQDTVFWRQNLWKKSGPIPATLRYAGDYWLWMQFAKQEKLWSLNVPVSIFRKRHDQLSQNMAAYKNEQKHFCQSLIKSLMVRTFFNLYERCGQAYLFKTLYNIFIGKNAQYIDKNNNQFIKRPARSFIAQ